jgi:hypothetical protein
MSVPPNTQQVRPNSPPIFRNNEVENLYEVAAGYSQIIDFPMAIDPDHDELFYNITVMDMNEGSSMNVVDPLFFKTYKFINFDTRINAEGYNAFLVEPGENDFGEFRMTAYCIERYTAEHYSTIMTVDIKVTLDVAGDASIAKEFREKA